MTDQPTDETPAPPTGPTSPPDPIQPPPPAPPAPDSPAVISPPPDQPSGVGFAAIRPPVPGGPPPVSPPYAYDYTLSSARGGGPSVVVIAVVALVLVLVVGGGAMFAFNIWPFTGPSLTPSPTAVAAPSQHPPTQPPAVTSTPGTTGIAHPSPGATATPVPSGNVAAQLLSHVPSALADSCVTTVGTAPIVAAASCNTDEGAIQVSYLQYDSQQTMFQAYEGFRLTSGIEPETGDCEDPASWPAESGYNIGGQPEGRWLCTEALGATTIYWTDDRLNILSQATHTTSDYSRLVQFWIEESGPNL